MDPKNEVIIMTFEKPKKNPTLVLMSQHHRNIETVMSWVNSGVPTLARCD